MLTFFAGWLYLRWQMLATEVDRPEVGWLIWLTSLLSADSCTQEPDKKAVSVLLISVCSQVQVKSEWPGHFRRKTEKMHIYLSNIFAYVYLRNVLWSFAIFLCLVRHYQIKKKTNPIIIVVKQCVLAIGRPALQITASTIEKPLLVDHWLVKERSLMVRIFTNC